MSERKRGRPVRSEVRQNLIDILAVAQSGYGYELHKYYIEIFGPITRETIYYNLKKGVDLKEFIIKEVKQEVGEYSWGKLVEKTYYALGPNSTPRKNPAISAYFARSTQTQHDG
jgi:hypothetical protein